MCPQLTGPRSGWWPHLPGPPWSWLAVFLGPGPALLHPDSGSSSCPQGHIMGAPWLALQLGSPRVRKSPRPHPAPLWALPLWIPHPLFRVPTATVLRKPKLPSLGKACGPSAQLSADPWGSVPRGLGGRQVCAPPSPGTRPGACPHWVDYPSFSMMLSKLKKKKKTIYWGQGQGQGRGRGRGGGDAQLSPLRTGSRAVQAEAPGSAGTGFPGLPKILLPGSGPRTAFCSHT